MGRLRRLTESSVVTRVGTPPAPETRWTARMPEGANRIALSRLQLPPRPYGASHSTNAAPPASGTFFSFRAAKNPMDPLSGDQKGRSRLRCGIGRAASAASGRGQISYAGRAPATNTMFRPSGETATWVAMPVPPPRGPPNDVFSGGTIVNCTGPAAGATAPERRSAMTARRSAPIRERARQLMPTAARAASAARTGSQAHWLRLARR